MIVLTRQQVIDQFNNPGTVPGMISMQRKTAKLKFSAAMDHVSLHGGRMVRHLEHMNQTLVSVPIGKELQIALELYDAGLIDWACPHHEPPELFLSPNDPYFTTSTSDLTKQWNLALIECPAAWDITRGSPAVTIGVGDDGIAPAQGEITGKVTKGQFFPSSLPVSPDYFNSADNHGTATSGMIGAVTNNGAQLSAVGFDCQVCMAQMGKTGALNGDIPAAIEWLVTSTGCKVHSYSWGFSTDFTSIAAAIAFAQAAGVLVIVAAGNNNTSALTYPAAYSGVISVAATNASDAKASYSTYGSWVTIAAPGGDTGQLLFVLGFNSPPPAQENGTSFACPTVAGVAALMLAVNPSLSASQITSILTSPANCNPVTGFTGGPNYRVNARKAVTAAKALAGIIYQANLNVDALTPINYSVAVGVDSNA